MEFSYSGLDELVQQLDHLDKDVEGTLNEALEAGAAAVTDAWQEEARARGHVDTGDMVNAIRPTRPWKTKSAVRGIAIYPQGKDRHGIRNATKAFWINYGTSPGAKKGIPGDQWVDAANSRAEAPALEAMQEVFDRIIESLV